jgi:hypothetical protein
LNNIPILRNHRFEGRKSERIATVIELGPPRMIEFVPNRLENRLNGFAEPPVTRREISERFCEDKRRVALIAAGRIVGQDRLMIAKRFVCHAKNVSDRSNETQLRMAVGLNRWSMAEA